MKCMKHHAVQTGTFKCGWQFPWPVYHEVGEENRSQFTEITSIYSEMILLDLGELCSKLPVLCYAGIQMLCYGVNFLYSCCAQLINLCHLTKSSKKGTSREFADSEQASEAENVRSRSNNYCDVNIQNNYFQWIEGANKAL